MERFIGKIEPKKKGSFRQERLFAVLDTPKLRKWGVKKEINTTCVCDYFNDWGVIKVECKCKFPYPKLVKSYDKLLEKNQIYDMETRRIDRRKRMWK